MNWCREQFFNKCARSQHLDPSVSRMTLSHSAVTQHRNHAKTAPEDRLHFIWNSKMRPDEQSEWIQLWRQVWFQTYKKQLPVLLLRALCFTVCAGNRELIGHFGQMFKKKKNPSHRIWTSHESNDTNCSTPICSCLCGELEPTFMPNVITVTSILKTKARANCHRAVYRPSPAGRSPRVLPTPVSDVFAGCKVYKRDEKKQY